MIRIGIGVLLACVFTASSVRGETVDIEGIVARNLPSVVLIHGKRQDNGAPVQGSGCVIHPEGYILATAHQAQGVRDFSAKFSDGATTSLSLVEVRPEVEFALFKAATPLPHVVTVGDASILRGGAPLISIASPINLEFTTVSGTVANPNKTYENYEVLLASLTATHGSSGGPVFDREGRLIGLISGGLNEVDFTIVNKINNAYPMLRERGILPPTTGNSAGDEDVLIPVAGVTQSELRAIEAYNRGVRAAALPEKIEAYGLAYTLLPAFYEACFNLAVAEARSGNGERAIALYQQAETLRPEALEVKRNLGRLYLKKKAYAEAIAVFESALTLTPGDAQAHNDLGESHRRAGNFAEAIEHFQASLAQNSDAPQVHFNLALAYANSGKAAEAIRHFNAYLALSPTASDVENVQKMIARLQASAK